jgi:predicted nucleic acid-binding protein
MVIHADSSFLIDLLREQARGKDGPATTFVRAHATDRVMASVFVVCEIEAGAVQAVSPDREQARVRALLQAMAVAYPDDRFAPAYGELLLALQRRGHTVATMDLLIATAAIVDRASLVTANRRHFAKIPGLELLPY